MLLYLYIIVIGALVTSLDHTLQQTVKSNEHRLETEFSHKYYIDHALQMMFDIKDPWIVTYNLYHLAKDVQANAACK